MIYTIKQFIKNGVHLGHYKWECDYRLSYFLLGLRNSIHIINLYYTLFILKQALSISYNMCYLGHKILIANNVGYTISSYFEKINKKKLIYINNDWICGLLSNQRTIFLNNESLFLNFYGVGLESLLPSYVFASNIKNTKSCIFEAMVLDIPSSALIDSNIGFYGIFYGINSNDDNFLSTYLFTKLFVKVYLKSYFDNIICLNKKKLSYLNMKVQKLNVWQLKNLKLLKKQRNKINNYNYKNKKKNRFHYKRNAFIETIILNKIIEIVQDGNDTKFDNKYRKHLLLKLKRLYTNT